MFDAAPNATIDVVRGRLDDEVAADVLRFWSENGALEEDAGRERLDEVVCVLRDDAGAVVGVNSAFPSDVPLLGGRSFWIYRSFILPAAAEAAPAMAHTAIRALESGFDPSKEGPVGVCMPLGSDRDIHNPEVTWVWPPMLYAGHLADGREVRIHYFYGAMIGPPRRVIDFGATFDRDYTVHVFGDRSPVDAEAVIDLWTREDAMPPEEARRRVGEVLVVATHGESSDPVGVTTVFLARNEQLGMDLWHLREFVSAQHRFTRAGWALLLSARAELERRYATGEDTRGAGILIELENQGLMYRFDDSVWPQAGFTFIGENEHGSHVRVNFFPGATVPQP